MLAFSTLVVYALQTVALAHPDVMGVALIGSGALLKSAALGIPLSHGIAMGVVTAIGH